MKKNQRSGYLVIGSILICIVSVLIIYFLMIALGLVQVSANHILITTESAEKMYDGEELTADGWEIVDGELLEGHYIEAEVIGTQTDVGESDNIISVAIFDSEGADVTEKYEIEYQLGTLSVKGKRLEFTTGSAGKYYDGTPLSCEEWTFVGGELMENHEYSAYTIGQITNIGSATNEISVSVVNVMTGENVTRFYSVECNEGELVVSPRRLVISIGASGTLSESGGDISSDGVIISGNLLSGHRAVYEPIETTYGEVNMDTVFVRVLDENGNDVTEFYEIVYPVGDMTIENANTYLPQNVTDMLNTNEYKQKFEETYGDIDGENGIDINGDGVPDIKVDENGNIDTDGDGTPDLTVDENGMIDINGDGEGDIPAALGALAVIECYKVTSDTSGYVYLREKSYGDYDGNDWKDPAVYNGVSPYLFSVASLEAAGRTETYSLKITPLFNNLKYVLPYYYVDGPNVTNAMNDCYTDENASANTQYEVSFVPYDFSYSDGYSVPSYLAEYEQEYFMYVLQNYLGVADSTKAALLAIAAEQGIDATDPSVIEKVAEYIRNAATYNMSFADFPDGADNIIYFLTEGKEGVCRHFAAAATLMYRSLGIPARYVTGFATSVEAGQETTVYALQAHAWVEVYISGFGWVQIEVTPSSSGNPGEGNDGGDNGEEPGDGGNGGNGGMSGTTVSGENPMGGGNDTSLDDVKLFSISSPQKGAVYLRSQSFGDFDGTNWLAPEAEMTGINPFTFTIDALESAGVGSTRTIMIQMIVDQYPYMLPYYSPADVIPDGATVNDNRIIYTWVASEEYTSITYTYYDYVSSHSYNVSSALASQERAYREAVNLLYKGVNEKTADGLREYANKYGITGGESNLVELIAECIKNSATYTLNAPEIPAGEDSVLYFLNVSKLGKCSHFATAATLMYRAFDIPARYTVGYMVNITNQSFIDVTGKNAHAWVEVYIDGMGWVKIEVTPPAQSEPQNKKTPITVVTTSYSKIYDGTGIDGAQSTQIVWTGSNGFASQSTNAGWERSYDKQNGYVWVYTAGEEGDGLHGNYFYEKDVKITGQKTLDVGSVTNTYSIVVYDADGNNVTSNYEKRYVGTLKIDPIKVEILTDGGEFAYDEENGIWFDENAYTVTKITGNDGKLLDGHTIKLNFTYGSEETALKDFVESADNTATAQILENGVDVSKKYYQIIVTSGKITMY